MDYEKLIFGPTGKYALLSVDEMLKLVAVATTNGSIIIYSQFLEMVHRVDISQVTAIQFVKGKGSLVALSDDMKIHVLVGEGFHDASLFTFVTTTYDVGLSHSLFHICQNMSNMQGSKDNMIPLLTVDKEDSLEMILIRDTDVVRTTKATTRLSADTQSNHIIQIAEIEYKENKLTILVLWCDRVQLVRFTSHWSNPATDTGSLVFDLDHIVCSYSEINHMTSVSVINSHSLIVCTSQGQYCTLRYNRSDHDLVLVETVFPYGPFPCKGITKCEHVTISGMKGDSCIFIGGLPAVTYVSVNSVSVARLHEPEICFSFYDPVVDFDVIRRRHSIEESMSTTMEEIVVLTEYQLITIVNNKGLWTLSSNCHLSPLARSEIVFLSNIIEMGCKIDIKGKQQTVGDQDSVRRFVSTFHKDNNLILWQLSNDVISKHTEIDLSLWCQKDQSKVPEKSVLWPTFQKGGVWKNPTTVEDFKIKSLKLIPNDGESCNVLFSLDNCQIICLKIFYKKLNDDHVKTVNVSFHKKFVTANVIDDYSADTCPSIINENISGIPSNVELQCLVTIRGTTGLSDVYLDHTMISFGGPDCVGVIDMDNGKNFYISSEELSQVESSQSTNQFSELIFKRLRKQKSFESSNLRKSSDCKSPKLTSKAKLLCVECFHFSRDTDSTFDLLIGFHNGLIMVLSLAIVDCGDIIVNSTYRRLSSRSKEPVMSLCVLNSCTGVTNGSVTTARPKTYPENPKMLRNSFDSTKGSSLSTGSKSTNISSGSGQVSVDKSKTNSMSKKLSFKGSTVASSLQSTNVILIRCDGNSVKIIDYLKLKTRFKFKLKEQLRKSETTDEKSLKPRFIQGKIVNDNCLLLFCNTNVIKRFSLPNLEPILSINICEPVTNRELLSMNKDVIIIGRNISVNDQSLSGLVIFTERTKTTRSLAVSCHVKESLMVDNASSLVKLEGDHGEIDFMRCAEPSINSLLW